MSNTIPIENYIQGEKFNTLADNIKIYYRHTHDVNSFFSSCNKQDPFILVSHNSDGVITNNPVHRNHVAPQYHADIRLMPDNCVRWFGQNLEVEHERIESLPIGMENGYCCPEYSRKELVYNISKTPKNIKNLIYLNLNISNNPTERDPIYNMIKDKSYVTNDIDLSGKWHGRYDRGGFENYLNNVYNHHFMVCPEGNGIDVHQPWESMYINTIPIQKKNVTNKNWRELPICWLDDWSQLEDESFLLSEHERISNGVFDRSKLNFDFWKSKITNSI